MRKVLHKLFEVVAKLLNKSLSILVELVSEVSHFISEPRNIEEVTILPADVKKS